MTICRGLFLLAACLTLVACPKKDDEDEKPNPAAPPATVAPAPDPAPTPTPTTDLKVEGASSKIELRVKAELDGRTDGITGTPLSVAGAKASLQAPTGWQTTKGDFTVSSSADKKAQLAAGALGTESATAKLPAAASALGLASCEWNPPEPLTVGPGKAPATAADGVCTRGGAQVKTAYVSPNDGGLLVVGAWEQGGDVANMFGAMRSITKPTGTGDGSGIAACCAALHQNANSAPPEQKGMVIAAAAMCDSLRSNPQGRAALAQVRGLLAGANVPSTCR
jgi:hypothetical protein